MADLLERIQAGKLDPVYILSSEQPLLVERAVAAIVDATVPPATRGFNYEVLDGKGLTANRITSAAQTLPMMAQRRLIQVRDLAAMSAAELGKLVAYLDAPCPTTVVVAVSSKIDKRLKLYATAQKKKLLHELSAPKRLDSWITAEAAQRRVSIESNACARLADVVGKDLARASLALDQLALYAGSRRITADDVDNLIADTRERSVFELSEALGDGDLARALEAVASLCEQRQSAIGVVAMLARYMRQLGLCHVARMQRLDDSEAARFIGVPPFVLKKLMAKAQRYSPAVVTTSLDKLATTDRALKGQTSTLKTLGRQLGEHVMLDRLVTEIISLRSR